MQYTKEEFKKIVDKFNAEKFKWIDLLNTNVTNWERTKAKIKDYPSYYDFVSAREFRYWLKHSEEDNFIQQRFCPICGKFIEVQKCGFQGKYKVGCEEHVEQIRMKNVQNSMMKKYGFITPGRSKEVWKKIRQTNLERYGVEFPLQNEKIHAKTIETGNLNGSYIIGSKKGKETKKELYGDENYNNSKQISETKINQSEYIKNDIQKKCYYTKKQNHSFSISKPENSLYTKLVERFKNVKNQYRSILYPFACDYYLPEFDLYIEYQGFKCHGKHPFNPNNPEDLKIVEKWEQKAKEINWKGQKKNLYKNFIQIWTVDDPLKRKTAKDNSLNFLEIFPRDFHNNYKLIIKYIEKMTLQNTEHSVKSKMELTKKYGKTMTNCTREYSQAIVEKYWEREWEKIKQVDFPSNREFPITEDQCLREIKTLYREDKSNKSRSSTVLFCHDNSRKKANVIGCLSPYEYWQKLKTDSELFKKFYENRLRCSDWFKEKQGQNRHFLDEGYVPMFIYSIGLTTSRKAPLVSYFKPSLAKNLIKTYLNDFETVFDPCSGYSGRLIGALCADKNYIGQDINDLVVEESQNVYKLIQKALSNPKNCDVQVKDSLACKGKYECLLTCPPYGSGKKTIEVWENSKGEKIVSTYSCTDWVFKFLENYECDKYVFVVDDDGDKTFKDYVADELINTSHFGNNKELVLVFSRKDRDGLLY